MAELEGGDPYAEFGAEIVKKAGSKPTTNENPYAEFGGEVVKKKALSSTTGTPSKSGSGFEFSKPFAVDKPIEFLPTEKKPAEPKVHLDLPAAGHYKPLKEQVNELYRQGEEAPMYQEMKAQRKAQDDQEEKVINAKLDQYKKQYGNGYWGGVQAGMDEAVRIAAKGAAKGAVKLGTGLLATADMVRRGLGGKEMSAEDEAKNTAFYDKIDDNTNAGLPKDFHGSTALSRGLGGLAEFVPAILSAEVGGGASFFFDGVGGAEQEINAAKKKGAKFENGADDWYRVGKGAANLVLLKYLNSHVLTSKLPSALVNDLAGRATLNSMKSMVDSGVEFTAENIAKSMKEQATSLAKKLPEFLNKGAKAYAKSAADLSTLAYVDNEIKARVNRRSGNEDLTVMDDEQMAHTLGKIFTEDAVVFGGMGVKNDVGALFSKSPYKNMVVESLMADRTPENIKVVSEQVAEMGRKQGWSEQDIENTQKHTEIIGEAINKLPENFTKLQFNKGVDLITGRNDLQTALDEMRGHKTRTLDPALAKVPRPEEIALENKIDQANDKLQELVAGKKFKYLHDEEKGTYTKQLGEGKAEQITPERYNLEEVERQSRKEANLSQEQVESLREKFKKPSDAIPAPSLIEGVEPKPREAVVARPEEVAQVEQNTVHPPLNDAPIEQTINEGVYFRNGEKGIVKQDGQTLVFETRDKVYELGSVDEVKGKNISDFGIEKEQPLKVEVDNDQNVIIDGKRFTNEKLVKDDAINYDKDGVPTSVTLTNEAGETRTIRGENAQEIIYQYKLKQFADEATAEQIEAAIRAADEAIRIESETKPVEPETTSSDIEHTPEEPVDERVRPTIPRKVPIEPREVRKGSFKRRRDAILANEPSNAVEAVAHFFLKAGKLATEDFIRHTGFGFLKTKNGRQMKLSAGETAEYLETGRLTTGEKVKMSEELRMAKLRGMVADAKKGGMFADDIAHNQLGAFKMEEMDIVEEVVDAAGRSKEDILTNAERSKAESDLFGMTEKELAELTAEEHNELTDLMNALTDEEINGLSEGTRNEIMAKVTARLNKKKPEELFTPDEINRANKLMDDYTDQDGNIDWDGLEKAYYETISGKDADFVILANEPVLKQIFENGYENFNERGKSSKSENDATRTDSESTSENTGGKTADQEKIEPPTDNKDISSLSDKELERRWNDLEIKRDAESKAEFKRVEDEMIRRERGRVFDANIDEVPKVIASMTEQRKSGVDTFMEASEGRRVVKVAERYSSENRGELTDHELKRDFVEALHGNPESDYATGLQFRESAKEFVSRGGTPKELIDAAKDRYEAYGDETASRVVARMIDNVLGKSKTETVKPARSIEAPKLSEKERLLDSIKNRFKLTEEESMRKKELANKFRTLNDVSRIPTLIADKEFREYAGLVLKESVGEFAGFAAEMVDSIGEGIRSHLPQLYKDLGGKEEVKSSPASEPTPVEPPKSTKSFHEITHKSIISDEVRDTLNNVERETGRVLDDEAKQYKAVKHQEAFAYGTEVVENARKEFGEEDYAMNLVEYLNGTQTMSPENRSVIAISLENNLEKRILAEPENALTLEKQLKLVRDYSTALQRSAAIQVGFGILRQLARVGYATEEITNGFFSGEQRAERSKIDKAIQGSPDDINRAAEAREAQNEGNLSEYVNEAVQRGIEKQVDEIFKKLPSERRKKAEVAITAIDNIRKRLKGRAYDATLAVPVYIIDSGLLTIKYAIKAGVKVADAIEMGISKIKEMHGKEWPKEDDFRKDMHTEFTAENVEVGKASKKPVRKPLTPEQKIKRAKDALAKRIESLKSQIDNKQRELKARKQPLTGDVELDALRAQAEALKKILDKEVPKPSDPISDAKKIEAQVTKLSKEIEDLERQIIQGVKDAREAKKDPLESPEIARLKAEKQARLEVLEGLDPTPKDIIKDALVTEGFGRDINVTVNEKDADGKDVLDANGNPKKIKEVRSIIDWRKLAGEEGSVDKIQQRVEAYMERIGYTDAEIIRMQEAFVEEYHDLRASIIEKSLNELERRNTENPPVDVKTSARRLAELYNMGLFDKQADTYDYLMNNALGLNGLSQEIFFQAKVLAKGLSDLFKSTDSKGNAISQSALKHGEMVLNKEIESLLSKLAWNESNAGFKAATLVKEYIGMAQRSMLVSLPQAIENTSSGYIARAFSKIGYMFDGLTTSALNKHHNMLAKAIFKDINSNAGIDFGGVNNPFIAKSRTMEVINKFSDSQLYHTATSAILGRTFLEAADSMHKVALTEKFFVHNLIKILRIKGMKREEALQFVSEKLTGQSFEQAKVEARGLIEKVNAEAKKQIIPTNEQSVIRLANDLVKEGLIGGNAFNLKEVEASFKAAYESAGFELGHEVNNLLSMGVSKVSSEIQNKVNQAIKNKDWNSASLYTAMQVGWTNIINPFVGGGTNWAFLALQKTGIPTFGTLYFNIKAGRSKAGRIDLETDEGMKNLSQALKYQQVAKNANNRLWVGTVTSLLAYGLFKGTGADDTLDKWLKKNKWAERYTKKIAPPVVQYILAEKNKKVGEFMTGMLNIKAPAFDEQNKAYNAVKSKFGDKSSTPTGILKADGAIGDFLGSRISLPIVPYRIASDIENVYRGMNGLDLRRPDFKTSGYMNGFWKGGMTDFLGLRPAPEKPKKLSRTELLQKIQEAKQKLHKK